MNIKYDQIAIDRYVNLIELVEKTLKRELSNEPRKIFFIKYKKWENRIDFLNDELQRLLSKFESII